MSTVRSLSPVVDASAARRPVARPTADDTARRLDALTQISIDDLMTSIGLSPSGHRWLRPVFAPHARRFAAVAHDFDLRVAEQGLARGGQWMIERMTGGLVTAGEDRVPAEGPLIVLANHPGIADTVALFASLAKRPDLKVIALDRPFLRALPHAARHLLFLPDDDAGRSAVLRAGARHLQQGGALLTFPAGEIEPDPATFGASRALASLQRWSASYTLLARRVPGTVFVPALVSDVVCRRAQSHPLTRLRRTPVDREKFGAALQVSFARYRRDVARVTFGAPLTGPSTPAAAGRSLAAAMQAAMQALIAEREGPTG